MSASPATSGPGDKRLKKRWFAYFGANSMAVSILLHVLFGVGATFLVVEHFQKKHINFHATEPPAQHTEIEHKVELAKRNNVESAPPDLKRIVTTDVSAITLPEPPDTPLPDVTEPSPMNGVSGEIGMGMGTGVGQGGGPGGGGNGYGIPMDNAESSNFLVGTLYDLKQTPDGRPTDIAENQAELGLLDGTVDGWQNFPATLRGLEVLRSFVRSWDDDALNDYYKSPKPVYASQIWIPVTASVNAPKAFEVEGKVHARRWIIVYKGKITPPKSGMFRFIGFGDDFMVVHVNGQNVLDGSWTGEELDPAANRDEPVGMGPEGQPLKCGKWIQMEAGTPMDMEVLIGEGPGGASGFVLMIQEQGDNSPLGNYPVFQLKDAPIPDFGPDFTTPTRKMLFQAPP